MMLDHDQIRKVRADLGISQAALAQATGINRTILSGFETGQLVLRDECARKLTDFFSARGVELEDIASSADKRASNTGGRRPRQRSTIGRVALLLSGLAAFMLAMLLRRR